MNDRLLRALVGKGNMVEFHCGCGFSRCVHRQTVRVENRRLRIQQFPQTLQAGAGFGQRSQNRSGHNEIGHSQGRVFGHGGDLSDRYVPTEDERPAYA